MRRTGLKDRLQKRELSIGSWLSFQFLPLTEMLARDEFDWLVVDLEHTTTDLEEVRQMLTVIELAGLSPLVRVGATDPLIIKRVMDAGAHGVLVPDVRSAEQARLAVDSVYYPPRGRRGAGLARAQAYGLGFDDYRTWLESEAIVIVQIEHADSLLNMDDILGVDGVDGFMVGPYDLSASIGKPGSFQDPEVLALFDEMAGVVHDSAKPAGLHVVYPDPEVLARRIDEGYTIIAYGDDMLFYSAAVEEVAGHVRGLRG